MKPIRLSGLTAKNEAVAGTDAAPTPAANGVQLEETLWSTVKFKALEANQRDTVPGSIGRNAPGQPSGFYAEVEVKLALKGTGVAMSAAVRPEIDPLLRACSYIADTSVAGEITYTHRALSQVGETATLYCYSAGLLHKVVGFQGSASWATVASKITVLTVKGMALVKPEYPNPSEVVMPAITYARRSLQPPALQGNALTIDGAALRYLSATWDQAATIAAKPAGDAPGGHAGFEITEILPTLKTQIYLPALAAFNPWEAFRTGEVISVSQVIGASQYNTITVTAPQAQVSVEPDPSDKDKIAALNLTFALICPDDATSSHSIRFH